MILTLSKQAGHIAQSNESRLKLYGFIKDFIGYGLCSAAALGFDCGVLFGLTSAGMNYLPASALGFFAGMLLAYFLSVQFVYAGRRGTDKRQEALGFFAIGLAGLLLNQLLIFAFADELQLSLGAAKAFTAAAVFLFNFIARRSMLFSRE